MITADDTREPRSAAEALRKMAEQLRASAAHHQNVADMNTRELAVDEEISESAAYELQLLSRDRSDTIDGVADDVAAEASRLEAIEPQAPTRDANGLLPCPFCGGAAALSDSVHPAYVLCTKCETRTNLYWSDAPAVAEAVAAWNTRAHAARRSHE